MSNIIIQPECNHTVNGTLRYCGKADGIVDVVYMWQCDVCSDIFEKQYFKKTDCTKHMWEFVEWIFEDNPWQYKFGHRYVCFNCGKEHFEDYSVRGRGMKGGVPDGPYHPQVKKLLALNRDVLKRIIIDGNE